MVLLLAIGALDRRNEGKKPATVNIEGPGGAADAASLGSSWGTEKGLKKMNRGRVGTNP